MLRLRRAPPPFRRAEVAEVRARSPRMQRVAVAGPELVGLDAPDPAASIRLLLPHGGDLVLPEWDGNEFLHADGSRPRLRTLTPLHVDPIAGRLEVDIVLHGAGPMATWALGTRPGDAVAISGTGRGYAIDADAQPLLLAGDESALPAISTILQALPMGADVEVLAEVATADAILELDGPEHLTVTWCEPRTGQAPGEALAAAVEAVALGPGTWVWAAGEAAAVQRIRRHLFETLGLPRRQCTVRGYWKHGRAGAGD